MALWCDISLYHRDINAGTQFSTYLQHFMNFVIFEILHQLCLVRDSAI